MLSTTLVILFYDAFITFDREVACFWTAKLNGASLLFFANRWITVTLYVMTLVSFASFPSDKVSRLSPGCRGKSDQKQRLVYPIPCPAESSPK